LTNPSVIFEVVSESTERIDRGRKLGQYIHIPSLREYLIIAQDEMRIDHLVRSPEDNWRLNIQTQPDATVHLESISFDIKLSDIYRRVQFPSPSQEPSV
jgi:Uma2 family endonuclease